MTQPKEKDPISLEIYEGMLNSTGAAITRLKKRLKETNMAFQLKPPEDEKFEVMVWEQKIHEMVDFKEKFDFPTVMDVKRTRAKRQQGMAEKNAEKDRLDEDRKAMHASLAKEANRKLSILREHKHFGKGNTFGGPGDGQVIKTIEGYSGMNCIYNGERTLIRKDGRLTKQVSASEVPPWIGPQYYANLDPPFLAKGLFPQNGSQVPFKSATNGRNLVGRSAKELRDAKIIRREKLDSWKNKEPGPRYCKTPERLSPERILRHHGYIRTDDDSFIKEDATVASTVVSGVANPWASTDRRSPLISLGELTRQMVLVEQEDAMRARLPLTKRTQIESSGPSALKMRAENMLREATSYITTSNTLSAKLARHERTVKEALDGGIVNGRVDYTKGALNAIENVGARAEQTHPAPSVTGSDNASVGTSLLSSKVMHDENPEDIKLGVTDIAIASPAKLLLLVSKDVLNGEDSNKGEKMSVEEKAKEAAIAENAEIARLAERRRKEYMEKRRLIREEYEKLSPIKQTFSRRKLPLTSPIKPRITQWLKNPSIVYHRSKEPEFLAPALERKKEEMLAVPGIERKDKISRFDGVDDLLMSDENRESVREREEMNDEKVNDMFTDIVLDYEKKEKNRKLASKTWQNTDDYSEVDAEEEEWSNASKASSSRAYQA